MENETIRKIFYGMAFVMIALVVLVWGSNIANFANVSEQTNSLNVGSNNLTQKAPTGTCGTSGGSGGCGGGCGGSDGGCGGGTGVQQQVVPSPNNSNNTGNLARNNSNLTNAVNAPIGTEGNGFVSQKTGKLEDAENAAYAFYVQKYGDGAVTASAVDRGCHVEVNILKNGNTIRTLGYSGGQIYDYQ